MNRITFEVTEEQHHKIKVLATLKKKTIKSLFLDNLLKNTDKQYNLETIKALRDIENKKNLNSYKTVEELFKNLGI